MALPLPAGGRVTSTVPARAELTSHGRVMMSLPLPRLSPLNLDWHTQSALLLMTPLVRGRRRG